MSKADCRFCAAGFKRTVKGYEVWHCGTIQRIDTGRYTRDSRCEMSELRESNARLTDEIARLNARIAELEGE